MRLIQFSPDHRPIFLRNLLPILLLAVLWSCADQKSFEKLPGDRFPALAKNPCTQQVSKYFPVDAGPTGLENPDYYAKVNTGPYTNADCMCKVQRYDFTFSGVIDTNDVVVTDAAGRSYRPAFSYDDEGNLVISVTHNGNLPDRDLTLFIEFTNAPQNGPLPTLRKAGGLCIVDNISGVKDPGDVLYHPYKEFVGFDSYGDSIWQSFIPDAITTNTP